MRSILMMMLPPTAAVLGLSWAVATWVLPQFIPAHQQSSILMASSNSKASAATNADVASDMEGYWPDCETCLELGKDHPSIHRRTAANQGCPQWRIQKDGWDGRTAFLDKLLRIEMVAKAWEEVLLDMDDASLQECDATMLVPTVYIRRERGVAWSRVEENVMAGNTEFRTSDDSNGFGWTDAVRPLYVETYGVEPSERAKTFVADFDVEAFEERLEALRQYNANRATDSK